MTYNDEPLEYVQSFKYLGLNFNSKCSFVESLDKLCSQARKAQTVTAMHHRFCKHSVYFYTSARPEVRGTADVGWRSLFLPPINPPRTHSRLYHHMCTRTDGR